MPHSLNYSPVIDLISTPRLSNYVITFKPISDAAMYGAYVWAQHAAASLYTLTQSVEITLRNSIDREARKKFGDYWWKIISYSNPNQAKRFFKSITRAEEKLVNDWEDKERKRLNIKFPTPIPTSMPVWTHDQIVAATDFSAWQFILLGTFYDKTTSNSNYLWPQLLGKAFKNHSVFSAKPDIARQRLIEAIQEVRELRNRISHHEPIWAKGPSVVDAKTAISTIVAKIDKMERLISAIDIRKLDAMSRVGLFYNAKRICSVDHYKIYTYSNVEPSLTSRKKRVLRSLTSSVATNNTTASWTYSNSAYGLYKIR